MVDAASNHTDLDSVAELFPSPVYALAII